MEIFDLYNRCGEKLNKTMVRGENNLPGEYHKVVHIWIQNSRGEYLIQQRNKPGDYHPYQWAPTAGAVISGENALDAVVRETKEEIGVDLNKDKIIFVKRYFVKHPKCNHIIEQFVVEQDVNIEDCKIDSTEVKAVMYASMDEINQMLLEERFWDFSGIDTGYLDFLEEGRLK